MSIVKAEFEANLKVTLVKSGKKEFLEEDVAVAMFEIEQEVNTMLLPSNEKGVKRYVRLHVGSRKGEMSGDYKDKDMA